jgi:hypothetical protein
MKKYFLMLGMYGLTALLLAGCPKNDQKTVAGTPDPTLVAGATCPANTTWNSYYCVNPNGTYAGCPTNYTYDGAQCIPNSTIAYISANEPNGIQGLDIIDQRVYQQILKTDLRVCNQSSGWYYGIQNCNYWTNGSKILRVRFNGLDILNLDFWARAKGPNNVGIGWNNPFRWNDNNLDPSYSNVGQEGYTSRPLRADLRVAQINNNTGFSAKTYGYGYSPNISNFQNTMNYQNKNVVNASYRYIELRVESGKLGDPQLNYVLYYNTNYTYGQGAPFARGTLMKCASSDCMNY